MNDETGPDGLFADPAPDRAAARPADPPSLYEGTVFAREHPVSRRSAGGITPARSFRLPVELSARLDVRAAADGVPASEITRRALEEYLKR